jgi:hypothetical protein
VISDWVYLSDGRFMGLKHRCNEARALVVDRIVPVLFDVTPPAAGW